MFWMLELLWPLRTQCSVCWTNWDHLDTYFNILNHFWHSTTYWNMSHLHGAPFYASTSTITWWGRTWAGLPEKTKLLQSSPHAPGSQLTQFLQKGEPEGATSSMEKHHFNKLRSAPHFRWTVAAMSWHSNMCRSDASSACSEAMHLPDHVGNDAVDLQVQ